MRAIAGASVRVADRAFITPRVLGVSAVSYVFAALAPKPGMTYILCSSGVWSVLERYLLPGFDGHPEVVLGRWVGAVPARAVGARGVVREVEVEDIVVAFEARHVEVAARAIGLLAGGGITEGHEQFVGPRVHRHGSERGQAVLLP